MSGNETKQRVEYKLEEESELRFEVECGATVTLEMVTGTSEIFGTELTQRKYTFQSGAKVGVFTWDGCTLTLTGQIEVAYIAKETPMCLYINTHMALEQMRIKAEKEESRGPRVMVVGPTDVGKSTLCRILCNYAAKLDRAPIFVDLDVGQNEISIPGTLGAVVLESPSDIEEGYSHVAPINYHFGHKSPSGNIELYKHLVSQLAETVNMRCENIDKSNISGIVINTPGWVKGQGYPLLTHAAGAFEVDIIIVLDQERLYNELRRDLPEFVKVILQQKSGGVVERSQKSRIDARDSKIKEYYYGLKNNLYPQIFDLKFDEIQIFKVGAPILPDSMLPMGQTNENNHLKLVALPPSLSLVHHVLSVSTALSTDEDIVQSNVFGYITITKIDMEKEIITVLAPSPYPLPSNILLMMEDIQFVDIR